jgi:glycerol kinase
MEADFGEKEKIKVDGGAAVNNLMMQFQSICSDLR